MSLAESILSSICQGERAIAVQSPLTERNKVLETLAGVSSRVSLPLYYRNSGYSSWQKILLVQSLNLIATDWSAPDLLQLPKQQPGIFVVEGVLVPNAVGAITAETIASVTNVVFSLKNSDDTIVVFLEAYLEIPPELVPLIPVVINPCPNESEIELICSKLILSQKPEIFTNKFQLVDLVRLCLAIPTAELEMLLRRCLYRANSLSELIDEVLEYRKSKFKGRGVEFVNSPDVPEAAGLDLLDAFLDRVAALLRPEAKLHNLGFTRGILLWGPPGTGKSLSAKLAAKKIGVPMVCADWGGLRGQNAYESRRNLLQFLDTCDILGKEGLILYFDDFDKGFAGFDSADDGGVSRQMAGKLLTWMQEHTSKVLVFATINRLGFIPPELIRRFEENIFFVDLPHAGARHRIFQLHLNKYAPGLELTERDWRLLLNETNLLTPAEIGNLVKRTATEVYYRTLQSQEEIEKPLSIEITDLLEQRANFTPSMERDEDQLVAIRNQAHFARSASSPDTSTWAKEVKGLFE
jgi:hypothetical protein